MVAVCGGVGRLGEAEGTVKGQRVVEEKESWDFYFVAVVVAASCGGAGVVGK